MSEMRKGQKFLFEARRETIISGHKFRKGDNIEVTLNRDIQNGEGQEGTGAWGRGGYTRRFICSIAEKIKNGQTGAVIYKNET